MLRLQVFALEHRYYGESVPVEDYSTPNLQWLSSAQALADLASFVGAMRERHGLHAPANRWVTFGGSYPGMLAAWARLEYPHLVHAAVASSAPVHAVVNFQARAHPERPIQTCVRLHHASFCIMRMDRAWPNCILEEAGLACSHRAGRALSGAGEQGYNDVVAESLRAASVGGSDACEAAVRSAFAALGQALDDAAGRRRLEQLFNVCEDSSEHAGDRVGWEGPLDDVDNRLKFSEVAADVFPVRA